MQTRQCRTCQEAKPISSFPKYYGRSAHLREHTCGMCKKRAHIARHPEYAKNEGYRRRARAKGVPLESYLQQREDRSARRDERMDPDALPVLKRNRRSRCPLIASSEHLIYVVNREYHRKKAQQWAKNNPDKAYHKKLRRKFRHLGVVDDLTTEQWNAIVRAFKGKCAYCGQRKKLTRDHITPVSDRGPNTLSNVVPACLTCNIRKRTGPPPVPVQPMLIA